MKRSDSIINLVSALHKAQSKVGKVNLTAVNPFHNSKYADLSEIMRVASPVLLGNGLTLIFSTEVSGEQCTFSTEEKSGTAIVSGEQCTFSTEEKSGTAIVFKVIMHVVHESGEWIQTEMALVPKDMHPQSIGSCITYGRRYLISGLLGIVTEVDDDANAAQPGVKTRPQQARPMQQQAKPTQAPQQTRQQQRPVQQEPVVSQQQKPVQRPAAEVVKVDYNGEPLPVCPQCGGPMWDNRKGLDHAPEGSPDFRCKNRECRNEKGFTTVIWRWTPEPEDDQPPLEEYYGEFEPVDDDDILF